MVINGINYKAIDESKNYFLGKHRNWHYIILNKRSKKSYIVTDDSIKYEIINYFDIGFGKLLKIKDLIEKYENKIIFEKTLDKESF